MNKSDFAIYKKGNDIFSMGFKFDNLLMQKNLPAMVGGGTDTIHNSNNGLPVGLALLNKKFGDDNNKTLHRNIEGGVISDELYTKLLNLADTNAKKKKRTITRKKKKGGKSKKKKKNKTKKYK